MVVSVALFVVAGLIITIWLLIEAKRMKHKIFAVFLIVLILFTYLSFVVVVKDENIDYKTVPGIIEGGKLYFAWLNSLFGNLRSITAYAIGLDWKEIKKNDDFNKNFSLDIEETFSYFNSN